MPAKKKNKQEQLAKDIADLVGAGKEWHLESVDFSDPNRPKTCLEVDFPIVPINNLANIESTTSALKRPLYMMSKWWARRPESVFRALILSACTKAPENTSDAGSIIWNSFYGDHQKNSALTNKLIYDPFMGGGTTLVEAARLGFHSAGNDLNPVAWFVVNNEVSNVTKEKIISLLNDVRDKVDPLIKPYYSCSNLSGNPGKFVNRKTNSVIDSNPWEIPLDQRTDYKYSGAEILFTFWCKWGEHRTLGETYFTPMISNPAVAQQSINVKYWEVKCPDSDRIFHLELPPNQITDKDGFAYDDEAVPIITIGQDGSYKSPFSGREFRDLAAIKKEDSVSLGGKARTKKVTHSVVLSQDFLSGIKINGNVPFPTGDTHFRAYQTEWIERAYSKVEITEVRNYNQDSKYYFEGNLPKKGKFLCRQTGRLIDYVENLKKNETPSLVSPYLQLCYDPEHKKKFFRIPESIDQITASFKTFNDLRETDLMDYLPSSAPIPEGVKTGELLDHQYQKWMDVFNPRQLLGLSSLLRAIIDSKEYTVDERLFAIGGIQQFLRCQNMMSIWHQKNNQISAFLSNNHFNPKHNTVESGFFNKVGDGSWESAIRGILSALEWKSQPWDFITVGELEKIDSSLCHELKSKTVKVPSQNLLHGPSIDCASSTDLRKIKDKTVDAVITDPPFGDNINYAELSDFFYPWLKLATSRLGIDTFRTNEAPKAQEAISNPLRHGGTKGASEFYKHTLTECWRESYRILRDGGLMAFTFHHSKDEPWVDVLSSLFDAGFYLEATYPIRGDEIKGKGEFGSQLIEYDIIHVCRKRLKDPARVSWARLRRKIMDDVRELKKLLEQHSNEGLPDADVRVIKRGKALEYYSQHYGQVFVEHGREFSLKEALVGINQLLDDDEEQTSDDAPPITAEAFSRQFLRIFRRTDQVANDQMQKTLRGTGMSPADFEKRGWCKKEKKVFNMVSPLDWAQQWKGQNRKGMARDLDQTLFLIGACFEDSGIKVWDTLNSPNFRHHPAIPDLLEWFTSNGADNTVKAASHRARTIYLDWMERNKPEVEQAQAEFDFLEE